MYIPVRSGLIAVNAYLNSREGDRRGGVGTDHQRHDGGAQSAKHVGQLQGRRGKRNTRWVACACALSNAMQCAGSNTRGRTAALREQTTVFFRWWTVPVHSDLLQFSLPAEQSDSLKNISFHVWKKLRTKSWPTLGPDPWFKSRLSYTYTHIHRL